MSSSSSSTPQQHHKNGVVGFDTNHQQ
ncbi:hypothetical protein Tco_0690830, partial [Tanacetum coccineum]